ncbi:MAG: chemotaxis protein CheW [Gallionella sp.]|nr:chemotaxis protein CheW [Gallionella sp.]
MRLSKKPTASANVRELVTFTLCGEEYAIDIHNIHEIRGYDKYNSIVNTRDYINGVINHRGVIVPLLDMRIKFSHHGARYDEPVVVIILNIAKRLIGIIVDAVSDIIALAAEHIKPATKSGSSRGKEFIAGLGSLDGRKINLVDIEKLLASHDMGFFELKAA